MKQGHKQCTFCKRFFHPMGLGSHLRSHGIISTRLNHQTPSVKLEEVPTGVEQVMVIKIVGNFRIEMGG